MSKNNIAGKLSQFEKLIFLQSEKTNRKKITHPAKYNILTSKLNGELVSSSGGTYCLVKETFPFSHKLGNYQVDSEFLNREIFFPHSLKKNMSKTKIEPDELLFIDTETTGLGGSGSTAFLVGIGSISKQGFEIRQYFLPDYSDESFMLEAIREEISSNKILVSYNGASFDIPLLNSRLIINRLGKSFKYARHIDLLVHSRRIFKRRLKNCKLTNIEQELFQFYRTDDIPGYLVPYVYFEWLNNFSLKQMNRVLLHNRLDILSLFYLFENLHQIYSSAGKNLSSLDDLHCLSKHFDRIGEFKNSEQIKKRIFGNSHSTLPNDILLYHSLASKKSGNLSRATNIWENLSASGKSKESYLALIELAKYWEHKQKDFAAALKYARKAKSMAPFSTTSEMDLNKRIFRLNKRLKY